jgi:hypothetical protein
MSRDGQLLITSPEESSIKLWEFAIFRIFAIFSVPRRSQAGSR